MSEGRKSEQFIDKLKQVFSANNVSEKQFKQKTPAVGTTKQTEAFFALRQNSFRDSQYSISPCKKAESAIMKPVAHKLMQQPKSVDKHDSVSNKHSQGKSSNNKNDAFNALIPFLMKNQQSQKR